MVSYSARGEENMFRSSHQDTTSHEGMTMRIFVGNIDFATTETELSQLFESYGVVRSVQMMQDRETGRPRGFGFVEMPNAIEARAAIAGLQGASLGGRTWTVSEARPREERDGPRREPRRPRR